MFLFKKNKNTQYNFCRQKQKKNKHKFVTILKSPHINKTAQEQFEYKFFTSQIVLYSTDLFFCYVVIKRIFKKGFPGLKIKLLHSFDKKNQNKVLTTFLNPDNVLLSEKKKIKSYFLMFDSFGEVCLQNFKKRCKNNSFLSALLAQLDRATAF